MKRTLLVSMAVCICVFAAPTLAETWGDYTYTPTSATTCTITNYTGLGGDVTIPDTLGELQVTTIGDDVFKGCSNLTSVIIPNSANRISGGAFQNCTGLTSVTIGNSVTTIWNFAFDGCSSLTSITIPTSVTASGAMCSIAAIVCKRLR
jgi:hypothetical protein